MARDSCLTLGYGYVAPWMAMISESSFLGPILTGSVNIWRLCIFLNQIL